MEFLPEEYTRYYIVQALFKLMDEFPFEEISVTDVAKKAGVGRATFYRYFKRKEDVLTYYFERHTKEYVWNQRLYPRCKADYVVIAEGVFSLFLDQKEPFRLIKRAHLEYLYLDYLNRKFTTELEKDYPIANGYEPYLYAGMLFNVSMAWLDRDCDESPRQLAQIFVNAIYFDS